MSLPDREPWSEDECLDEFRRLFPHGLSGDDVLAEIAPEGWEKSPLRAAFHPSFDQVYEETLAMHRNLENLSKARKPDAAKKRPKPTREEVAKDFEETPIEPKHECAQLVGECVWDIFSDNHEVVGPDGRVLDLGSFRGSAGFIADFAKGELKPMEPVELPPEFSFKLPEGFPPVDMSYLQFYMGSLRTGSRTDLGPIYRMIFRRLKARGHGWIYHFPKLSIVDLRPLRDELKEESGEQEWENYDPSAALAEESEEQEKDRELEEMRESLAASRRKEMERARQRPAPKTVAAYQAVYGRFPQGWPPVEDAD